MEINTPTPPAVFVGVSESDGNDAQQDFGQLLTKKEDQSLIDSGKVLVFHRAECQYCSDLNPTCRYCHGKDFGKED